MIYLAYGALAGAYSWWLLATIATRFGRFLVGRYGAAGTAVFAGFLLLLLGPPLRRSAVAALRLLKDLRHP